MKTHKCKICNTQYKTHNGLAKHLNRTHKINFENYYIEYYLDGVRPLCECGCGKPTKWVAGNKNKINKFSTYIHGHFARVNNPMQDKKHTDESRESMSKTRLEKFENDENYSRWNKGIDIITYFGEERWNEIKEKSYTEERSAKISEHFKGKPKSPEHYQKLCKQLAVNRHNRLTSREPSLPEKLMAEYLDELNLKYETEYPLDNFHYDFYIKELNLLIEVDGDYWHGNPKFFNELDNIQRKNNGLDKVKNSVARQHDIRLIRFWEDDIKNNKHKIIDEIA